MVMYIIKSNSDLWDLFIKREEYNPPLLDQYQRFPYYLSKHRDIFTPIISKFLIQKGLKIQYPDDKAFGICLTHDIDIIKRPIVKSIVQDLQQFQINKVIKSLLSKFGNRYNILLNFNQIMNLEEKYHGKSSFYFLALDKRKIDFNYELSDIKDYLIEISNRGFEIGLHGGHEAFFNLEDIKKQKAKLESIIKRKVLGYRNHYIRFKIPTTWNLLKLADFDYDTTFGYADCIGFRNGLCYPFKPYNLETNSFIDIWEIPLTIMDSTLDGYMHLTLESAWNITRHLIDAAEKYKGIITILWHNTNFFNEKLKFYEKILKYCHEKNAWMTSGEEIWSWWKENNFLEGYIT